MLVGKSGRNSVECDDERRVGGEETDIDDGLFILGTWLKVRREM